MIFPIAFTARGRAEARTSLAGVDIHHLAEQAEGVFLRSLEGVASHDRAKGATGVQAADLVEDSVFPLGGAAGEDHDASATETGVDDVLDALGQGADRDLLFLVDLLGRGLLEVIGRRLDLDDVGAELTRDLGGVGDDVDGGLAVLGQAAAPRVGPDHRR